MNQGIVVFCFCFEKLHNKTMLPIEALGMMWGRPENTNIMSSASIDNNYIIADA